MTSFVDDLISACRSLVRRPAFTLATAFMLAIGLGFNTALFAVVHSVLLRPLPYVQPDRIVMAWTGRNPDGSGIVNSYADYLDWKAKSHSFTALAAFNISFGTLSGVGDPEEIGGATVSPEFFPALGAQMFMGRPIRPGDELIKLEEGRPIVIAYSLWKRRFSLDPGIIGRTITLANHPRRVVGIVGRDFIQPEPFWGELAEYWNPLAVTDQMRTQHGYHYLRVVGRLADGVSLDEARAEMDGIGRQLMKAYPQTNSQPVVLVPMADQLVGDTRPLLLLFLGAVTLVLSLAVANIVNLLFARANGRRAELAVRAALGASRGRLISQLVAESTMIGLTGGLMSLGFAEVGIRLLLAYGQVRAPGIEQTALDSVVVAFAIGLSALTGALCGIVPAFRVARARLSSSLSNMRGSTGLEVSRARTWLVAAEMALAVPLLVGAALLTETLVTMQRVDLGFDPAHALQFRVTLAGTRYETPAAKIALFNDLLGRLVAPSTTSAGIVSSLPLGGLNNTGGSIVYEKSDGTLAELGVGFRVATSGYFASLGIPLRQGRLFSESEGDTDTVVINERAAHAIWGAASPLGRRVALGSAADEKGRGSWLTVIGVVGGVRHEALTEESRPEIFQPYRANPWSTMTVVVRSKGDPASVASLARAAVRAVDAGLPLVGLGPVATLIDGQLARPRFGVLCAGVFGALGLALAAFGTFAVLTLLVAQRTKEIGIRMTLGAAPGRVGWLILRQSLVPALAGCLAGGVAAAWLSGSLASQLFGVKPHDLPAFASAAGSLVLVALVASWWPARRAQHIDPVKALRSE
jgi:putative ABC transport system permease protein